MVKDEVRSTEELLKEIARLRQRVAQIEGVPGETQRYHHVLNSVGDGVCFTNPKGIIEYMNPTLESLLGYQQGELLGKPVFLLYPGGLSNPLLGQIMQALASGGWSGRAELRTKNGQRRATMETASLVQGDDGRLLGYVCINRDITDIERTEESLKRQSEVLEAISRFTGILVRPGTFEDKMSQGMEELAKAAEATWASLWIPEESGSLLRLVTAVGPAIETDMPPSTLPLRNSHAGNAFLQGRAVVIHEDPFAYFGYSGPLARRVQSLASLPIRASGEIIAVASLISDKRGHFSPKRLSSLEAISSGVGVLLENVRLYHQAMESHHLTEALNRISNKLNSTLDYEEVLQSICQECRDLVDVSAVSIWVDEDGQLLTIASCFREKSEQEVRELLNTLRQTPPRVVPRVIATREAEIVNDLQQDPLSYTTMDKIYGAQSLLVVPMLMGDRCLGAIALIDRDDPLRFRQQDMEVASAFASHAAMALENARLYQAASRELEQGRRRLEAFREGASRLVLGGLLETATQDLVDLARTIVGARYGGLALWDQQRQLEEFMESGTPSASQDWLGSFRGEWQRGQRQLSQDRILRLMTPPNPLVTADAPIGSRQQSFIGVPIVRKGVSSGALYLADKEGGSDFSSEDREVLDIFGMLAGVLLDNNSLYREVEQERTTLTALQASMTEGLAILDESQRIIYRNKAVEGLTSVPNEVALGKTPKELVESGQLSIEPFEARVQLQQGIEAAFQGITSTVELTLHYTERREIASTFFPIGTSLAHPMVGILTRDITQERELDRRRTALVYVASHELRTPMTTIVGFAELLLRRDRPEATQRRWLEHIHRDSLRLSSIVDDLLNVSRIQSGRLKLNVEEVSLPRMLVSTLAIISPTSDKHQVTRILPEDLPLVLADPDKLMQVLINLVDNAVKYSPNGGPITLAATHHKDDDMVVVSVEDHGIGIGPEDQNNLFTTFHRIRRPETEGIRGTGLGLYIVKELVEIMGGDIWLKSQLNEGSTFYFSVPTATPQRDRA